MALVAPFEMTNISTTCTKEGRKICGLKSPPSPQKRCSNQWKPQGSLLDLWSRKMFYNKNQYWDQTANCHVKIPPWNNQHFRPEKMAGPNRKGSSCFVREAKAKTGALGVLGRWMNILVYTFRDAKLQKLAPDFLKFCLLRVTFTQCLLILSMKPDSKLVKAILNL